MQGVTGGHRQPVRSSYRNAAAKRCRYGSPADRSVVRFGGADYHIIGFYFAPGPRTQRRTLHYVLRPAGVGDRLSRGELDENPASPEMHRAPTQSNPPGRAG